MALPPERISVKRRRDEDPLEALYIQSKKYRPSAVWTLQGSNGTTQLASTSAERLLESGATLSTNTPAVYTPTSLTVSTATDALPQPSHQPWLSQELIKCSTDRHETPNLSPPRPFVTKPTEAYEKGGNIRATESRLRRFHLSHEGFPGLKRQASFTGGIRKHRKPQRDTLALFVETDKGERAIEHSLHVHSIPPTGAVPAQDVHAKANSDPVVAPIRKRPKAGTAERAWRAETWSKQKSPVAIDEYQDVTEKPTNWDEESILLAEELHQFAMQESKAQKKGSELLQYAKVNHSPESPESRDPEGETYKKFTDTDPAIRGNTSEDGDYVVDTYIRSSLQQLNADASLQTCLDPLQALDCSKVGILIVEEEQEALWESLACEQASELEIESDEEDENAEDFHGNDYPEDEIDVEDEADRGSYDSCNTASDDDEYNDDEPEWSEY